MFLDNGRTNVSRETNRKGMTYLRIDRNICSVHEEITSIRLYTPCNPPSGLRKGVYNLTEVISNEPNK
jgi:hypothetical protein